MQLVGSSRFGGYYLLIGIFALVSLLSRTALLVQSWEQLPSGAGLLVALVSLYLTGLFYDLVTGAFFGAFYALLWTLLPDRVCRHPLHRYLIGYPLYFVGLFLMVFSAFSEWFFWEEFNVRFNFIAVDYVVYTHEVIGNIVESYPLPALLTAVALLAMVLLVVALWLGLSRSLTASTSGRARLVHGGLILLGTLAAAYGVEQLESPGNANQFQVELSKNGLYSLFHAFRHNQLDYDRFYPTMDPREGVRRVRASLAAERPRYDPDDFTTLSRHIDPAPLPPGAASPISQPQNVILVVMESMSAEFVGVLDRTFPGLTPNLDRLANQGMLFTRFFATGTRTVMGLESVALSRPPTPGTSVIKRPRNEGMFSAGFLFRQRGYDTRFIYGGYGYFDNMNGFFSQNGFDITDRTQLAPEEIRFANIWGVSDEDLYARVIREADRSHQAGRPFFHLVMTTSNHRPFTYPEGKIDIPSHTGRLGGVKYADYAIGALIQQAERQPWFANTLFLFVADHCASSAGRNELEAYRYLIPFIIYQPHRIAPRRIDRVASQVDVIPTLLGLLGWSYPSRFFGVDLLRTPPGDERAFISNYQKVALIKDQRLTILSPVRRVSYYALDYAAKGEIVPAPPSEESRREAIAFFQTAANLFDQRLDRWNEPSP